MKRFYFKKNSDDEEFLVYESDNIKKILSPKRDIKKKSLNFIRDFSEYEKKEESYFFLVFGFDGDIFIKTLLEEFPESHFILVLQDPELLKNPEVMRKLNELYKNNSRLVGLIENPFDSSKFMVVINAFKKMIYSSKIVVKDITWISNIYKNEYNAFLENSKSAFIMININAKTTAQMGVFLMFNDIENNFLLSNKVKNINLLQKIFGNLPVICVSGGPSTKEYIEELKKLKHLPIFCVGASYKYLIQNDIYPDFLFFVDPMDDYDKYVGEDLHENTYLVVTPRADANIFLKAPKIFFRPYVNAHFDIYLYKSQVRYDQRKYFTRPSTTVAHEMIQFALYTTYGDILLFGQDLAYKIGEGSHVMHHHSSFSAKTIENSQNELIDAESNIDGKAKTTLTFISFKDIFEQIFLNSQNKIYNFSTFGLKIKNTVPANKNVLDLYFENNYLSIDKTKIIDKIYKSSPVIQKKTFIFKKALKQLKEFSKIVDKYKTKLEKANGLEIINLFNSFDKELDKNFKFYLEYYYTIRDAFFSTLTKLSLKEEDVIREKTMEYFEKFNYLCNVNINLLDKIFEKYDNKVTPSKIL